MGYCPDLNALKLLAGQEDLDEVFRCSNNTKKVCFWGIVPNLDQRQKIGW